MWILLLVAVWGGVLHAGPGIQREFSLEPPVERSIQLPDSFIIADSLEVRAGRRELISRADYRVNLFPPTVLLSSSVATDSALTLRYVYLPLGIPRTLRYRVPPTPGQTIPVADGTPKTVRGYEADLSSEASLMIAGTKTVGVRFGTGKDPGVDQSLQVQVGGTIAGDVAVSATLADETSPIQPQGTTQELRDLDRIVIDLKRKDDHVSIGDCTIAIQNFSFLSLERKLQGITGGINEAGIVGQFGAATTKGVFTSVAFAGAEGKQGPYQLSDELAQGEGYGLLVVLSGTEKVWLDGRRMTRGSDRDYVIDYSQGTVTFTENHLITDESRIAVDFQYTRENYRRTVYAASAERGIGSLIARSAFFREADDAAQPLGWSLSDEDRDILSQAGNDPLKAVAPSYRYVGPGMGTYDTLHVAFLMPSNTGTWTAVFDSVGSGEGDYRRAGERFEYYGPYGGTHIARPESLGSGPYAVTREVILVSEATARRARRRDQAEGLLSDPFPYPFSSAFDATFSRQSGGDYARESSTLWRYVGPGHGDYVAKRFIAAPKSHNVMVVGLQSAPSSHIGIGVEAAFSDRDENTLSESGNDETTAGAIEARLSLAGDGGNAMPAWEIGGSIRDEGDGFVVPGRSRPVDWDRGWSGAQTATGRRRESLMNVSLQSERHGRLRFMIGELKAEQTTSRRAQASGNLQGPWAVQLGGTYNYSNALGERDRRWWTEGSMDREGTGFAPLLVWKAEEDLREGSGTGHTDIGAGLRFQRSPATNARVVIGRKTTKETAGGLERWITETTGAWWELLLAGAAGGRAKGNAQIKHTASAFTDEYRSFTASQMGTVPEDVRSTVASARLSLTPLRNGPSLETGYKLSGRAAEKLVEELVREEEWETNVGEYDSLGNWVGTELGTHKKVLVPAGDAERVSTVEGTASLRIRPGSSFLPILKNTLYSETTARIQATSRTDRDWELYLLRPDVLNNDSTTIEKRTRIEQRIELRPRNGEYTLGFQWSLSNDRDNRRQTERRGRRQERVNLRCRGPAIGSLVFDGGFRWSWDIEREERDSGETMNAVSARSRLRGISVAFTQPLPWHVDALLGADLSLDRISRTVSDDADDEKREAVLRNYEIAPGLRWAFPGKGTVTVESRFRRLDAEGPWLELAPFLRRTDRVGTAQTITIAGDYRLQEKLTLSLTMALGKRPDTDTTTEGTMELVAFF